MKNELLLGATEGELVRPVPAAPGHQSKTVEFTVVKDVCGNVMATILGNGFFIKESLQ